MRKYIREVIGAAIEVHRTLGSGLLGPIAIQEVAPICKAQVIRDLKRFAVPLGLLINVHAGRLADGISCLYLPGANQ